MEDDDDRLAKAQRLQAILTAVEELLEGVLQQPGILMAASTNDHGTATLLRGFQALHDAAMDAAAEEEAEAADGVVVASSRMIDVDPNAPRNPDVADQQQHGGAGDNGRGGDGSIDDVDSGSVNVEAYGFNDAVRRLQDATNRRPIDELYVSYLIERDDDDDDEEEEHDSDFEFEDDGTISFTRFVTLLGLAPDEEGGRVVRGIDLDTNWCGCPGEDVERLFREVLPGHPTLQRICIRIGELPAGYLRLFTESVPTEAGKWPLSSLQFDAETESIEAYPDDFEDNLEAIVEMVARNAAIEKLSLELLELEADQCRLICQAVRHNTNLRDLTLRVQEVLADTLDGVVTSSLRQLYVRGSYSEGALRSLARQLRTNDTLEELWVVRRRDEDCDDPHPLLDLAKTYNYTLRSVHVHLGSRQENEQLREQVDGYMKRNERIRNVLQGLKDDPSRTVSPAILAMLLEVASDIPTLLQRFVKRYYVNVVTERLALGAGGGMTGRRGRRSRRRLT